MCAITAHCFSARASPLPVTDIEEVVVRYSGMFALLRDLRAMGMTSLFNERSRTPLTRSVFLRAAEIYAERFSDPDGRIRASFPIVHLSGWAPHESQQKPLKPGSAKRVLPTSSTGTLTGTVKAPEINDGHRQSPLPKGRPLSGRMQCLCASFVRQETAKHRFQFMIPGLVGNRSLGMLSSLPTCCRRARMMHREPGASCSIDFRTV
jgi:hypothetical protein